MAAVLCYPYGVTITCVCDNTGSVYNCYPTNYKNKHQGHVGANSQAQVRKHWCLLHASHLRNSIILSQYPHHVIMFNAVFQDERLAKSEKSRGDQTVEIILATTALVTVIALFLR